MPKPPRRPAPAPMQSNEVLVLAIGTALWAVAFLVLLAMRSTLHRHSAEWWLWVCVAGVGLGLLGLRVVTRRRARRDG